MQSKKLFSFDRCKRRLDEVPVPRTYLEGTPQPKFCLPYRSLMFVRRHSKDLGNIAYHHRYVLVVNFEGEGKALISNHLIALPPGYALLIFPHQFHHFIVKRSGPILWLVITFEIEGENNLSPLRSIPVRLHGALPEYLEKTIDAYVLMKKTAKETTLNRYILALALLLNELASEGRKLLQDDARLPESEPADDRISAVNAYIMNNFRKNIRISDIAREVNLSADYIRNLYRKETNLTLGYYIKRMKLARAMELLNRSSMNLTQIAWECGFGSLVSFSRYFKKYAGMSPRQYRKTSSDHP
jgi:AraC-like DNA-binding protein